MYKVGDYVRSINHDPVIEGVIVRARSCYAVQLTPESYRAHVAAGYRAIQDGQHLIHFSLTAPVWRGLFGVPTLWRHKR